MACVRRTGLAPPPGWLHGTRASLQFLSTASLWASAARRAVYMASTGVDENAWKCKSIRGLIGGTLSILTSFTAYLTVLRCASEMLDRNQYSCRSDRHLPKAVAGGRHLCKDSISRVTGSMLQTCAPQDCEHRSMFPRQAVNTTVMPCPAGSS
jgi:hypothetical protein